MRLHSLQIQAFGPFADSVDVDFDALSQAGIFLLSGATGSGKTSILDAVCFALYGQVPGDRGVAKDYRCRFADPGVVPRVQLEFTVGTRRLRIQRSPSWQRPKKRGRGWTTQQSSVVISEWRDDQWSPLSTRLDETGDLLTNLLGMTARQFTQIAMLPQGNFQEFLRASSDERQALLHKVFQTGRFDQVERWLRDHRTALRRESGQHQETIADLLSRISEVSAKPPPHGWESPDESDQWATAWRREILHDAQATLNDTEIALTRTAQTTASLSETLEHARLLCELQASHDAASAELRELEDSRASHDADLARLGAAQRSDQLSHLNNLVQGACDALAAAGDDLAASTQALTDLTHQTPPATVADLEALHRETIRRRAEVTRLIPLVQTAHGLRADITATRLRIDDTTTSLAELDAELRELPPRIADARGRAEQVRRASEEAELLLQQQIALTDALTALEEAHSLSDELARAESHRVEMHSQLLSAKESWNDLRERRLNGMAAELAADIAVGGCCPVCGSHKHPSLARSTTDAVNRRQERQALSLVEDLNATLLAHDDQIRGLSTRLATAKAKAGESPDDLPQRLAAISSALELKRGEALDTAAEGELRSLSQRHEFIQATRHQTHASLIGEQARIGPLQAQLDELQAQINEALGATEHDDLTALSTHLAAVDDACADALRDQRALITAQRTHREVTERLTSAAIAAGFADAAEAIAAALTPEERQRLQERIAEYRDRERRVQETLTDPEVLAASALPRPDLVDQRTRLEQAEQEQLAAQARHHAAATTVDRVSALLQQLTLAVDHWRPVREAWLLADSVTSFVEGKHPDNALQMRLSAYVLAHRLGQVVDAANERLATMSDQRYSLQHTGERGAGQTRGGLTLRVLDDWSGDSRDPATLSGGETFVVSLALALGLADVIAQEAGGTSLDTLFVDEGFGSLDAETLDDVLDVLDTLRDGGRVVGVVSHVAEMQDRIPVQVRVHKGRAGSTLTQSVHCE